MIIDGHVHIHPFPNETNGVEMPGHYEQNLREELARLHIPPDDQAAEMVRRMDAAGVDAAFVVNPHYPKESGHVRTNRSVYDAIKPFAGRLYALAGVRLQPQPDVDDLETALREYGFRGLKINVAGQYVRPTDWVALDPIYQVLMEYGLPAMWHPGPSFTGGLASFGYDSRDYYDTAIKYPDLKIVIAHCGSGTIGGLEIACVAASSCKNVYVDCSALLHVAAMKHLPPIGTALNRRKRFAHDVLHPQSGDLAPELEPAWNAIKEEYRQMIRYICNRAPGKLIYGTDLPLTDRWDVSIQLCREATGDEIAFQEIMADTAVKVFKL